MEVESELAINRVYLVLGGKCDFRCRHCIQAPAPNSDEGTVKDVVIEYLKHLSSIRSADMPKLHIVFWGGEPLLYLDDIKTVVEKLGNNFSYGMVTNGNNIDDEFVEYANAHNITAALSNDGTNTAKIRNINLLDNEKFVKCFSTLDNKSICSVISAYNADYKHLFYYLNNLLPGVRIYTELLRLPWHMPKDIYNFDFYKYRDSVKNCAEKAYEDIVNQRMSNEVQVFWSTLNNITKGATGINNCMQGFSVLNIDTQGNVHPCHNTSEVICTIKDSRSDMIAAYYKWIKNRIKPQCKNCEVSSVCNGGCPLEEPSKGLQEVQCKLYKAFYGEAIALAEKLNNFKP